MLIIKDFKRYRAPDFVAIVATVAALSCSVPVSAREGGAAAPEHGQMDIGQIRLGPSKAKQESMRAYLQKNLQNPKLFPVDKGLRQSQYFSGVSKQNRIDFSLAFDDYVLKNFVDNQRSMFMFIAKKPVPRTVKYADLDQFAAKWWQSHGAKYSSIKSAGEKSKWRHWSLLDAITTLQQARRNESSKTKNAISALDKKLGPSSVNFVAAVQNYVVYQYGVVLDEIKKN